MRMNLELVEALCGFQKVIETLDGRNLLIKTLPGEIVSHGDIKYIYDEGMPVYKEPFTKGRLIIHFAVAMPKTLDPAVLPQLELCLGPKEEIIVPDDVEEHSLVNYDVQEEARRDSRQAYDEDDQSQSRVQCASH